MTRATATRAVVADVRDRHDIDRVLAKAQRFEPGSIKLVSFKDEGEDRGTIFGPVTLYREAPPRRTGGVPFGTPDPDGTYYLGWLSKRQALTIARSLGASFVEF